MAIRTTLETSDLSQREVADITGIHPKQIQRIEDEDEFWNEVYSLNTKKLKKHDKAMWHSLLKQGKKGNVFAINTYLKATGQLIERTKTETEHSGGVDVNVQFAQELSDLVEGESE